MHSLEDSLLRKKLFQKLESHLLYNLNIENILANELEGFFLMDASIFHTFKVSSCQSLKLIGNVKNVLNSSYAYIRSYVMPGINYSISLSYAFN